MKNIKTKSFKLVTSFLVLCMLFATSCTNDLNTKPEIELSLDELLSQDPQAVEGILSRLYGSFTLTGASGPGSSDIVAPDGGETGFLRSIINLQEFAADGMKNRWGDNGLDQLTTTSDWTSENKFFSYLYDRVFFTIPQCNNLLSILPNIEVANKEAIISEVRFIRALANFYLIDVFGKGVIANEENYGQTSLLPEASRLELYNFVESELLAIEPLLLTSNNYGRATKGAAQMLLAKLYLNAEVYTGTAQYDKAVIYTKKVIEGPYSLATDFVSIFSADNHSSTEIIFPLIADAQVSQSYSNTTYIVNGSLNAETTPLAQFGATDAWAGHRASKAWYGLYGDLSTTTDERAKLFWTNGHTYEMTDYKEWTDGYPAVKFRNTNSSGSSLPSSFSPTDFPLFRLADAYLMYAECAVRGAGGADMGTAVQYVNNVRTRSGASSITQTDLTEQFIIDERGRELNLEGHRRTDLIRFGMFTGNSYLWPWKGGVKDGTSIPATYNLYPIPSSALQANQNLSQNPGF